MWAWTAASLAVHAALIATIVALSSGGPVMGDSTAGVVEVELLPVMPETSVSVARSAVAHAAVQTSVAQDVPEYRTHEPAPGARGDDQLKAIENSRLEKKAQASDSEGRSLSGEVAQGEPRSDTDASAAAAQLARAQRVRAEEESAERNRVVRSRLERFKHYPASAKRRGIEGAVDVSFSLNAQGRAENMQLVSGSGYTILDDAALSTVKRAEPFPVTEGSYRFRLRFTRS